MNQLTVEVTQEHIDKGVRRSYYCCPIACALKEPTAVIGSFMSVYTARIIKDGGEYESYTPSNRAIAFIKKFDKGDQVRPSTFRFKKIVKRAR